MSASAESIRYPLTYNACTEPCDMFAGPCACGAWHRPETVAATLRLLPMFPAMVRAGITEDMDIP